jgi:predicted NUDIX family NTP pyrophosphohydrolase
MCYEERFFLQRATTKVHKSEEPMMDRLRPSAPADRPKPDPDKPKVEPEPETA